MATTVTLSSKHQIVIPRQARELLRLGKGAKFLVLVKEDRIVLIPRPKDFVKRLAGLGKEIWRGRGAAAYLKGERDSWHR